ncbi:MAG: formylglycine-generating enzyme family protein [Hyphomicrobiaceae bacterium]
MGVSAADAQSGQKQRAKPPAEQSFRDCPTCPVMVKVPAGEFVMGSPATEPRRGDDEGPQRRVTFAKPFAIGKYEVTFAEWDTCVAKGGCRHKPTDDKFGRGKKPVINVSYDDAQEFVAWLARTTGKPYRLPTEAEWEYAARASTDPDAPSKPFSTGDTINTSQANHDGNFTYNGGRGSIYRQTTVDVGSLRRNAFGLHEMHGNVFEWVEDCYKPDYRDAPVDGSAVSTPDCALRIVRGGAWNYYPWKLRSAYRYATPGNVRLNNIGLRVALTLPNVEQAQSVEKGN